METEYIEENGVITQLQRIEINVTQELNSLNDQEQSYVNEIAEIQLKLADVQAKKTALLNII